MDKLMMMLLDLMNEQTGGKSHDSKEEKTMTEQVKKEVDGYVSLISVEERAAVEQVKKAVSNLVEVHNKYVIENLAKEVSKTTPLQRIIYMMCGDFVEDIQGNVLAFLNADTRGVKTLAEKISEEGDTFELLEKKLIARNMAKKLFR